MHWIAVHLPLLPLEACCATLPAGGRGGSSGMGLKRSGAQAACKPESRAPGRAGG
ncbi:MAG: hypothetical protein RL227_102, partial [Pseudomonadota bacterium]